MALQSSTISIPIAKGVGQKVDPKILDPSKLASIKDCVFNKQEAIDKRFGFQTLTTTVVTPLPNPIAIAVSQSKSSLFKFKSQLLLQNSGNVYTRISGSSLWNWVGSNVPIEVESKVAVSNNQSQTQCDSATALGVTVVAYQTSTGVYCTVTEEATGATLAREQTLRASATAVLGKVLAFSDAIWILYADTGNGTMYARSVSLVNGSVGGAASLKTDYMNITFLLKNAALAPAPGSLYADGYYDYTAIDASITSGGLLGEAACVAYLSSSGDVKIFFMSKAGAALGSPGTLSTGLSPSSSFSVHIDSAVDPNRLFFATQTAAGIQSRSWTFTASAFTALSLVTAHALLPGVDGRGFIGCITQAVNPVNSSEIWIFYDVRNSGYFSQGVSAEAIVYFSSVTFAGALGQSGAVYGRGFVLAAKALKDAVLNTIYLPCGYESQTQGSLFLMDVLKGKASQKTFVQAMFSVGSAVGRPANSVLPEIGETAAGSGVFAFVSNVKTALLARQNIEFGGLTSTPTIVNQTGVGRFSLNLKPTYAQSSVEMSNAAHVPGGYLRSYDGAVHAESNFFLAPEFVSGTVAESLFKVTRKQVGSGSLPEVTEIKFYSGSASALPGTIFRVFASGGTQWTLWFKTDGTGSAPIEPNLLLVSLGGTDTASEIAAKVALALNGASGFPFTAGNALDTDSVSIANTSNGAVSATVGIGGVNLGGFLSAGIYSYSVVWKWFDASGQIHRSAPSIAFIAGTATSGTIGRLLISIPPVTNRDATSIVAEVYRTKANGTAFYLCSKITSSDIVWSESISRYVFVDFVSDATLGASELLYTEGGVLENYQIPACKYACTYKNRVFVSGAEDGQAVYYSKTTGANEPVKFSSLTYFRAAADPQSVSGLAVLDDKLVVFKQDLIYVVSGDGANDLGASSTLSDPQLIATDVGCVSHASIVAFPEGLVFKSNKGFYHLTRALALQYIGADVEEHNAFQVSSGTLLKDKNEIRFTHQDSSEALVYNYYFSQWSIFTNHQSDAGLLSGGTWTRALHNGKVQQESAGYSDVDGASTPVQMSVELPWLKAKGIQDFQRVYQAILLGQYKSPHSVTFTVAYDYDSSNVTTYSWNTATALVGSARGDQTYQANVNLAQQECESLKIKMVDQPSGGTGQSATWNRLDFKVGLKSGLAKTKALKSV